MLPYTEPLPPVFPGVRRFASHFSNAGALLSFRLADSTNITSDLDDDDFWAMTRFDLQYRKSVSTDATGMAVYLRQRMPDNSNGLAQLVWDRSFSSAPTGFVTNFPSATATATAYQSGWLSMLPEERPANYSSAHFGIDLTSLVKGHVRSPREFMYITPNGSDISSIIWSIEWMQSNDPEALREALSSH